jgi:hypothetical protein
MELPKLFFTYCQEKLINSSIAMLTEKDFTRYQAVHREVCGEEITLAEAKDRATRFYYFMDLLYRPIRKTDYDAASEKWAQIVRKLQAQKALDDDVKNH